MIARIDPGALTAVASASTWQEGVRMQEGPWAKRVRKLVVTGWLVLSVVATIGVSSCRCGEHGGPTPPPAATPAPLKCACGAPWSGDAPTCLSCGKESARQCPACKRHWPPAGGSAGRCPWCGAIVDVGQAAPRRGFANPPELALLQWNPPPSPAHPSTEQFADWIHEIRGYMPTEGEGPHERQAKSAWMSDAVHLLRELRKGAENGLPEPLEGRLTRFLDEIPNPEKDTLSEAERSTWLVPRLLLLDEEFQHGAWPRDEASIREWILKLTGTVRDYASELPQPESAGKLLDAFEATLGAFSSPCSLSDLGTKEQGEWLERRLARLRGAFAEAAKLHMTGRWLQRSVEALREILLQARARQMARIDQEIDELEREIPP